MKGKQKTLNENHGGNRELKTKTMPGGNRELKTKPMEKTEN